MIIRDYNVDDAEDVLECHYSAVHGLGIRDYSQEVCEIWSPEISENRLEHFLQNDGESLRFVVESNSKIIGFAEYVPESNELRACYVHFNHIGKGIGKKLLNHLEQNAKDKGVTELQADSSLTALSFYKAMGYETIAEGVHTLRDGSKMKCVYIKKRL